MKSGKREIRRDVICGKDVYTDEAETVEFMGQTYYFCCPGCKAEFEKNPKMHSPKERAEQGARK